MVTRNAERDTPKRLYIVGPAVGRFLAADERPALKVTATGVKAFERQESKVLPVELFSVNFYARTLADCRLESITSVNEIVSWHIDFGQGDCCK